MSSPEDLAKSLNDRVSSIEMKLEVWKKLVTILSIGITAVFGVGFIALLGKAKEEAVAVVKAEARTAAEEAVAALKAEMKTAALADLRQSAEDNAARAEEAAKAAERSAAHAKDYETQIKKISNRHQNFEPAIALFKQEIKFSTASQRLLTIEKPLDFTPKTARFIQTGGSDWGERLELSYEYNDKKLIIKAFQNTKYAIIRLRVEGQFIVTNF